MCDKEFAELLGELSGAICLKTLILLGRALELFRKFFGTVRAIFWLWGSYWDAAFLLTVGSFLLTVELFHLQLELFCFLLTVLACLLTILAFCLQSELLCLQWESASNKGLKGL